MTHSRRVGWLLTILTLGSLAATQAVWDTSSAKYNQEKKRAALMLAEPALPSTAALKFLSLNQGPALADLLWLRSIQYFGQGNPYGQYPSLGKIITTVTELDPKFAYAYQFGLVVLPFMKQVEPAETLATRAEKELPNDGLITFYAASLYHLNLKDYKKAAALYEKASTLSGAPPASSYLAGIALASASGSINDRQAALAFWKAVYDNAKDDSERERAATWFAHMQVVISIEIAAGQFKTAHGRFPLNLQELVDTGYLPTIPESPIGRRLILDPATGTVDFSELKS